MGEVVFRMFCYLYNRLIRLSMKEPIDKGELLSLERLLFRRQFILGPAVYAPNRYWSSIPLPGGLHLSVHNDLPFATSSKGDVNLTLIGQAFDPYHPMLTNTEVLLSLMDEALELDALIQASKPLVGRWILLCHNHQGTYLFTDPCGFRQVFHYSDGKYVWCASQPELIRAHCPLSLSMDEVMKRFLNEPCFAREESAWVGSGTLYESCFHLMPNHYLNLETMEQTRFYPIRSLPKMDDHILVEKAAEILQGTMAAITARHQVTLALTAGWDSRVLLAASKHVRERIDFFVYQYDTMSENHPDIRVPERLTKTLGLKFEVREPGSELSEAFVNLLSHNVTAARFLPKTYSIYQKLMAGDDRININGNGSEVCRTYFDKYGKLDPTDVSAEELASLLYGRKARPEFAVRELQTWKDSFGYQPDGNWNLLDFLYWEQRLGNWGAQYPAEQDVANEEFSPFNCRQLLEILISAPKNKRYAPDYVLYQELIRHMWPEALSLPVNPLPKGHLKERLKQQLHASLPTSVERKIKKIRSS